MGRRVRERRRAMDFVLLLLVILLRQEGECFHYTYASCACQGTNVTRSRRSPGRALSSSATSTLKDKSDPPCSSSTLPLSPSARRLPFYSLLKILTTALYFKHALRKSRKDCERPLARIGLARESPLSAKTVMKIRLHLYVICILNCRSANTTHENIC